MPQVVHANVVGDVCFGLGGVPDFQAEPVAGEVSVGVPGRASGRGAVFAVGAALGAVMGVCGAAGGVAATSAGVVAHGAVPSTDRLGVGFRRFGLQPAVRVGEQQVVRAEAVVVDVFGHGLGECLAEGEVSVFGVFRVVLDYKPDAVLRRMQFNDGARDGQPVRAGVEVAGAQLGKFAPT